MCTDYRSDALLLVSGASPDSVDDVRGAKIDRDDAQQQQDRSSAAPTHPAEGKVSEASLCSAAATATAQDEDAGPAENNQSTAIFFARVPPTVPYDELHALFSTYGTVQHLNLYRRWATAKTSKGCGIAKFSTADEARAAMHGLDGVHRFDSYPGSEAPMVVEWMDPSRLTPPSEAGSKPRKAAPSSCKPSSTAKAWSTKANHINSIRLQAWQRAQQLAALHSRAIAAAAATATATATAAAAASASCNNMQLSAAFGLHPSVDAFGAAGLQRQQLSDTAVDASLGDPWGSGIPAHLLPMMYSNPQTGSLFGQPNLPQFSSAMPAASASAAMAMSGPLDGGHNIGLLSSAGGMRPIQAVHMVPSEQWLAPNLAYPSPTGLNLNMCAQLLPEEAWPYMSAPGQHVQDVLQPFLLPEDTWSIAHGSYASASATTTTTTGAGCVNGNNNYTLFEPSACFSQVHDVASSAAAAISACAGHNTGSADTSPVSSAGAGTRASGLLPPSFDEGLPAQMYGFAAHGQASGGTGASATSGTSASSSASMAACSVLPGAPGQTGGVLHPARCNQPQDLQVVHIPLSDTSLRQVANHIPKMAMMSGAEVQLTAAPDGMQLCLQGSAEQVDLACKLLFIVGTSQQSPA